MSYATSPVKRLRRSNAQLAELDNAIISAVVDEHPVSVRGVFYRVESAGGVDKSDSGYKAVQRELLKLRRNGLVPYSWITDGTRLIRKSASYDDLDQMLEDAAASYRRALWQNQSVEVMVFTEKDAISGILFPITDKWDVPLGVLRGQSSETFAYTIAEEIAYANRRLKCVYVYQFGDHDPTGVGAWRNFEKKVSQFVIDKQGAVDAVFERLAVTPEQIERLRLRTRPTKKTDRGSRDFVGESVEVDAVPAHLLRKIAEAAITQHIDQSSLELTRMYEDSERDLLYKMASGSDVIQLGQATSHGIA